MIITGGDDQAITVAEVEVKVLSGSFSEPKSSSAGCSTQGKDKDRRLLPKTRCEICCGCERFCAYLFSYTAIKLSVRAFRLPAGHV